MDRPQLEDRLSPAARAALEELMEELRAEIIARAAHASYGDQISVADLVRSYEERFARFASRGASTVERLAALYVALGAAVAAGSLAFGSMRGFTEITAVVVSTGLGLVIAAGATMLLRRESRLRSTAMSAMMPVTSQFAATAAFLGQWTSLEALLREVIARELGESRAGEPLSHILNELVRLGRLGNGEASAFHDLLRLRNAIVHDAAIVAPESLRSAMQETEALYSRLSGAVT